MRQFGPLAQWKSACVTCKRPLVRVQYGPLNFKMEGAEMTETLIFCKLRRDSETRFAWVPEGLARFGCPLKITDLETRKVNEGWFVLRVYRGSSRTRDVDQPPSLAA